MKGPKDFPLTPEQEEKKKNMIAAIEGSRAKGHGCTFVLKDRKDMPVYEAVRDEALAAGYKAVIVGTELRVGV